MVLREIMTKLGFSVDNESLNKYNGKIQQMENNTKGLANNITKGILQSAVIMKGIQMASQAVTASILLASDYQETLNKVKVAYGENSDEVLRWGKTTLKQFGLAKGTALDMAALYGDMGTGMGFTTDQAADMGTSLVGLAADMASFKNISIDMANTALKSIYTGETESLKGLGVVMTEANLTQFAMNNGITKNIKDMSQQEKVMLRYKFVLDATKNAQGDFARTNAGFANQLRMIKEGLKEMGTTLGALAIPMLEKLFQKINAGLAWFTQFSQKLSENEQLQLAFTRAGDAVIKFFQSFGLEVGNSEDSASGFADILTVVLNTLSTVIDIVSGAIQLFQDWSPLILTIIGVMTTYNAILWLQFAAVNAVAGATAIMNMVLGMNPIGLIIIGVGVLIGLFAMLIVAIIKNWDQIQAFFFRLGQQIKTFIGQVIMWFKEWGNALILLLGPFGLIINVILALKKHWGEITSAFQNGGLLAGIQKIGQVLLNSVLDPVIKILQALSKVPGMSGLAQRAISGISGFQDKMNGGAGAGANTAALYAQRAGAAPKGSQNVNVNSSISIQVPQGTPPEQQAFIQGQTRAVVREEMNNAMRTSRGSRRRNE